MTKTIILCDDHTLIVDGLSKLLNENPQFSVIGAFTNSEKCIQHFKQSTPNIFICDLNIDKNDGFAILEKIKDQIQETYTVILTAYDEPFLVEKAKNLGVNAFLKKSTDIEELFEVISRSINAPFYTNISVVSSSSGFSEKDKKFALQFRLSKKEIEIIQLVVKGKTSQEIGDLLFLSKFTVETHRRNIIKKLGISGTTTLQQYAYENNLFS